MCVSLSLTHTRSVTFFVTLTFFFLLLLLDCNRAQDKRFCLSASFEKDLCLPLLPFTLSLTHTSWQLPHNRKHTHFHSFTLTYRFTTSPSLWTLERSNCCLKSQRFVLKGGFKEEPDRSQIVGQVHFIWWKEWDVKEEEDELGLKKRLLEKSSGVKA